jgi:ketosteroid isomerase-like protein
VIVLGHFRVRGKATGKTIDAPFAHVWTLRDGKAVYHHKLCGPATFLESLG